MNESQLATLAAFGFFLAIIVWMTWRDHRKDTNAKPLNSIFAKFNFHGYAKIQRRTLALLACAAFAITAWWYYGVETFNAFERPNWIKGTLQVSGVSAVARLHNNRDGWIVEQVVLYVWSGKPKPCNKNAAGCMLDGGLPSIDHDDAEEKGSYRCGNKIGARPNTTFECSFTYPYSVGWGRRSGWIVSEIVARRVNPLDL